MITSLSRTLTRGMKIYTRTGDKGTSSLFTGARLPKTDPVFEALGTTDELSSTLGLAREYSSIASNDLQEKLVRIQCDLQDIGSCIATPRTGENLWKVERTRFPPDRVVELESWIDTLDETLPPLKTFILPVPLFLFLRVNQ